MVTVPLTTTRTPAADDHLVNARRAMTDGQFDIARREFSAALSEERSAGKLPVESSVGLADALYAQAYNREAAFTMEQLAKDAALAGDVDGLVRRCGLVDQAIQVRPSFAGGECGHG